MARFEITGPDGVKYEVSAPDDATEDQVLSFARNQLSAPQPQPAPAEPKPGGGWKDSFAGGVVRGLRDIPDGGAQLLTRGIEALGSAVDPVLGTNVQNWAQGQRQNVEGINQAAEQDYQQNWRQGQPPSFDAGRLTGNIAATLPVGYAAPGALAASLPVRMASGAMAGAGSSALMPTEAGGNFWKEKALQTATGATVGAAAPAVFGAVGRMISPKASVNPQVQTLMDAGVRPTPGQLAGGAIKNVEEKLTSMPVLGEAIKGAQKRGLEQFNRGAINKALEPIGQALPDNVPVGRESIDFAGKQISQHYDDLLGGLSMKVDRPFVDQMKSLMSNASFMPKERAAQFQSIIKDKVMSRFSDTGSLSGETMKTMESELGRLARQYRTSPDADQRLLGDALMETQATLRGLVERSNPDKAAALKAANRSYAEFMRVERAASSVGADEGAFTPAQLFNAVRGMDKSMNKRAFARGDALGQDFAEAGKSVLAPKVPNSGTTDRALLNAGVLGGGAVLEPMALLGLLGSAGAYTSLPQSLLARAIASRPDAAVPMANAARALGPAGSVAIAPYGRGLLSPYLPQ